MLQAKIIGKATSILKHESLEGKKLLLAVAVEPDGKPYGDPMIVLAAVAAVSAAGAAIVIKKRK